MPLKKENRRIKLKIITMFVSLVIVGVIVVVGYVYSGFYDVSATSPHGGLAKWVMSTTMHASVDRRAKDIDVPNLDDKALQLAGINDYNGMCTACHGAPGQDPEAIGQGLNPQAPDLQESAGRSTAAELFWVTKHGIKMTGMPAWGASHGDEELWPVVAFMTVLPELNAETYQSMLASAAGKGHHATAAHSHSHSEAASESTGRQHGDQPQQDHNQEHDHGGDDHTH